MTAPCPAILIAGAASGVGKTSISLGLVRALVRRGLRVQTFKVGPDFLDPSYLKLASGRTCYNLDGWMTGRDYVIQLFERAAADADLAVIEGVMGLFDGASPTGLEGSSAEVALWLHVPVLLVANAHGAARSLAALVKGFAEFEPALQLAGVIANQAGGERHGDSLNESLSAAQLPPLLGAVPRGALPALQSRHLGLVTADARSLPERTIDQLADACEKHVDLDRVLLLARTGLTTKAQRHEGQRKEEEPGGDSNRKAHARPRACGVRIGVARDEAFHFYYPDNLEILRRCGAELVEFSPLADRLLPPALDGLYIGGGYPEVHAGALADNVGMLKDIRAFAADGRCIYAECGGLMYLGEALTDQAGRRLALAGVLPVETAMANGLRSLGYVEATAGPGTLWCGAHAAGAACLRGHEFHYSHVTADRAAAQGWRAAYRLRRRRDGDAGGQAEGFAKGPILASYVHLHFASCPSAGERFVEQCRRASP